MRVVRVGTGRPHECVAGNIDAPGKQSNALTVGLGAIVCCFDFGASAKSDRPIGYAQHRSVAAITPQRCHTASLQPSSVTDVPGELGKEFAVVLRNNGGVTCQAQGWPGVSFVDAAGKDLGDAERRGSAPQVRTLPPGSTVLVTVGVSNPAGGNGCVGDVPDSRTVLLTPPNETAQLTVALPHVFLVCHPIVYPIGSAAQGS